MHRPWEPSWCCECGMPSPPEPWNICSRCLIPCRSHFDRAWGLPRFLSAVYCPRCFSYLQPPASWTRAAPCSPELLRYHCHPVVRRLRPLPIPPSSVSVSGAELLPARRPNLLPLVVHLRRDVGGVTEEKSPTICFQLHNTPLPGDPLLHCSVPAAAQPEAPEPDDGPLREDDLVILDEGASRDLGRLGPLVICVKAPADDSIALLDPFVLRVQHLEEPLYRAYGFRATLRSKDLVEYDVLGVELLSPREREPTLDGLVFQLADVQVARRSDSGKEDKAIFTTRTHVTYLRHSLESGDCLLGYDLCAASLGDERIRKSKIQNNLPDVILVKSSAGRRFRTLA